MCLSVSPWDPGRQELFLVPLVTPGPSTGGPSIAPTSFCGWYPGGPLPFLRSRNATQWRAGCTEDAGRGLFRSIPCWWRPVTAGVEGDRWVTFSAGPSSTPQPRLKWGWNVREAGQCLWDPWAQRLSSRLLYLPEANVVLPSLLSFLPSHSTKMHFQAQLRHRLLPLPLVCIQPQESSLFSLYSHPRFAHYLL